MNESDREASGVLGLLLGAFALVVLASGAATLALLMYIVKELAELCGGLVPWLVSHSNAAAGLIPLVLLLSVSARFGLRSARQWVATRRLLRGLGPCLPPAERLSEAARRTGVAGRVDLIAATGPVAFCHGLRHPRIGVSAGLVDLLDDDELTAVLAHERHHLERRDPLRILGARAMADGLGWAPGTAALVASFRRAIEAAADDAAVRQTGARLALASAIVKLARAGQMESQAPLAAFSATEARVTALLVGAPPARPRMERGGLLALALSLVIVLAASAGAVAAIQAPHVEPLSSCVPIHRHAPTPR